MNQIIPLKLLGMVAFIMVFTYTATGILYDDYESETYASDYMYSGEVMSFNEWLNLQWSYAYREYVLLELDVNEELFYNGHTISWIYADYHFHPNLFTTYNSGYDWFEHTPLLDHWPFDLKREGIRDDYQDYLTSIGYEEDTADKDMVDVIADFFYAIPTAIGKIYDVMSFNIPKMPNNIRFILNLFFIPLWVILTIGIAPLVISALQAVASFVDAIIPF